MASHAASWIATDADPAALEIVQNKTIQGLSTTQLLNAYQPQVNELVNCVFAEHWHSHGSAFAFAVQADTDLKLELHHYWYAVMRDSCQPPSSIV